MSERKRLVVIGGVAAGMGAASKARRVNPDLEIVVFEQGDWISYSACGLPYFVGGLVENERKLIARTVAEFAKQNIDARLRHAVTLIDTSNKTVRVLNNAEPDTEPMDVPYDELIIATGARPFRPPVQGIDLKGVFHLYTMPDALAIREYIDTRQPRHAVIVGGGYIGLEAAENLERRGIKIAVVQRPPQLFSSVDHEITDLVAQELDRHGVDLTLGNSALSACEGEDGRVTCIQTTQGKLDTDMVLLATGVRPNSELAAGAGIKLGAKGAIAVDDRLRTSAPNVYAAGDCAEHFDRVTGQPNWVPLGTTANKQGRIAGTNAAGGDERFRGIVATTITRVFDLEVGRTGVTSREAERHGMDVATAVVDYTDIAGYYPGHAPIRVKLIAEKGSGRLLGVQAAGKGVDKRIDVAATALTAGMTVEEFAWLDLSYAPPFNSVWDPLLVAANNVMKEL
ncbi:MAG TPA: FAD-dependent oxidoreductase [Roseiflexaceae bacterium]|nr:FAD-dependent oxidoreductase [Roseiflexaceae bacterium]